MNESGQRNSNIIDSVFTVLFFYGLLGALYGDLHLFAVDGPLLVSALAWKLSILSAAVVFLYSLASRRSVRLRAALAALVLALFAISDVAGRRFGFFPPGTSLVELWYLGAAASLVVFFLRERFSLERVFSLPVLILTQLFIAGLFLSLADGRLLFSDDHPSFLYRLHLLKEHFPAIPFYNPEWNAGYSAREFFPSGVLNVFFLSFPILWWAGDLSVYENAKAYTLLIPYLFIFVVPGAVYLAARVLGTSRPAAVIAAILALGPSSGYFEWLLKYGTMGFSLSIGLLPLCFALAFRLSVDDRKPRWLDVLRLLFVASMTLMWTLSALVFVPLVMCCLLRPKLSFLEGRGIKIFAFVALFLLINGPWLLTFLQESNVASFLKADTLPGSSVTHFDGEKRAATAVVAEVAQSSIQDTLRNALEGFRQLAAKVNPLLLLFFVPGIFLLSKPRVSLVLLSSILWLLLLAIFGEDIKPQLELRRMILPAAFLMCIPVGAAIEHLAQVFSKDLHCESSFTKRGRGLFGLSVVFGAVLLSVYTISAVYLNRSDEKFVFSTGLANNLSAAISEHGGEGRTFFLGFILQELDATWWNAQDGGHIAPLTAFSGKPIYASDFYHTKWSTVDPIPETYRARGAEGIEEFLDLVNATAVVSFKREWAKYCADSDRYEQVYKGDRFRLFKRKPAAGGYFLEGDGEVQTQADGLLLTLASKRAVLKFRYLPKLRVDNSEVKLSSTFAFTEDLGGGKTKDVEFIVLETRQPGITFRLSY